MNAIDPIDQFVSAYDRLQRQYKWGMVYVYTAIKLAASTAFQIHKQ